MNYTSLFLTLSLILCVLWMYNTSLFLVFGLFLSLSADVHVIWRKVLVLYFCKVRRKYTPKKIQDPNIYKGKLEKIEIRFIEVFTYFYF